MIKLCLLYSFIACAVFGKAQTQQEQDSVTLIKFNQAIELYENGDRESAIDIWKNIVSEHTTSDNLMYGSSFYNIPTVFWELNELDSAKVWYKKVLISDLDDSDETGQLMEPHANYKHNSARRLAGLAMIDSNYQEALDWVYKADTLYRYWGFEGSATNISLVQSSILASKVNLLKNMGRSEEAIREIVLELIYARDGSFFETHQEELLILTAKMDFLVDFESAVKKLSIEKVDKHNWLAKFSFRELEYVLKISNQAPDRNIPHYWKGYFINNGSQPNKNETVNYILETEFYNQDGE